MLVEIDENFYCGAMNLKVQTKCPHYKDCDSINFFCRNYMHKWPTPEQFKGDYGVDYPENAAVYVLLDTIGGPSWGVSSLHSYKGTRFSLDVVVCACTPWGAPPSAWRPS